MNNDRSPAIGQYQAPALDSVSTALSALCPPRENPMKTPSNHRLVRAGILVGRALLGSIIACLAVEPARATDGIWNTTVTNSLWSASGSWFPDIADGAGSTADFNTLNLTADTTARLDSSRTIGNLIFGDSDTSTAFGWTLDNNGTATNILTLAGTTPTITVNALGGTKFVTLSGVIAGASGLTKEGTGTLRLSNASNTITGGSVINGGTLEFYASGAGNIGVMGPKTGATALSINNGAAAKFSASSGSYRLDTSNRGIYLGAGMQTVAKSGNFFIGFGAISGPGGLIITGDQNGQRMYSATTYTGDTRFAGAGTGLFHLSAVQNSTVDYNNYGASLSFSAGSGTYVFGGLKGSQNLPSLASGIGVAIGNNGQDTTYSGVISGATGNLGLTKIGVGTMTLGNVSTYNGATTLNAGTLALGAAGSISGTTSIAIKAGAKFDVTAKGSYAMSSTQTFAMSVDPTGGGSAGQINAAGLDITNGKVALNLLGTLDDAAYVLATYTSLTGTGFSSVTGLPVDGSYKIDYAYNLGTQIAVVPNTVTHVQPLKWATGDGTWNEADSNKVWKDNASNTVAFVTGDTVIFEDTLSGSSPIAVTLNIGVTVGGSYVRVLSNKNFTITGSGSIVGGAGLGLAKSGSGQFTLGVACNHNGDTLITGGTLALGVGGTLSNTSLISLAAGSTFDVSALTSPYTLGSSATLQAAGTGTDVGTTAAVLVGPAGGTCSFGSQPVSLTFTPATFAGDTTHPSLLVTQGALTLGNNLVSINNASGTALGAGTYRLIQVGDGSSGVINGLPNPAVTVSGSGVAGGHEAVLVAGNGNVDLLVRSAVSQPIRWVMNDGSWDMSTPNWQDANNTVTQFLHGDTVVFDDTPSGSSPIAIALDTTVLPSSVTNDSARNYTLSGSGGIGGVGGLTKAGNGELTLAVKNTYTGATTINGGTLTLGDAGQLGGGTYSGNLAIGDGTTFHYNSSANQVQSGVVSGAGELLKDGAGTLTLSNTANVGIRKTVVLGGTLAAAGDGSFGGAPSTTVADSITLDGGSLYTAPITSITRGLMIGSNGGTLTSNGAIAGPISGSGSLTLKSGGQQRINSIGSGGSGVTSNPFNGDLIVLSGTVAPYYPLSLQHATLDLEGGAFQNLVAAPYYVLGGLKGTSSSSYAMTGLNAVPTSVGNNNRDTIFSGTITGTTGCQLIKIGAGVLTLTGTSTYSGPTTISAGTLALGAAGTINYSSGITVATGAVLDVSAKASFTMPAAQNVTFHLDGTGSGFSGRILAAGLDVDNAAVVFIVDSSLDDPVYVLADYTLLTGATNTFASVTLPDGYSINYAYHGGTQIALVARGSYADWAAVHAGSQGPELDYDHDGVPNGVEYFMGQTGSSFTPNPAIDNTGKVTWPKDPTANASYVVQISSTLMEEVSPSDGGWTAAISGVVDNGTSVEYTVPTGHQRLFVRLKVTIP